MSRLKIASIVDREVTYELCKELVEVAYKGTFGFSESKLRQSVDMWLESPRNEKIVVLAFNDADEPVGIMAAYVSSSFFSDEPVAQHVAWYTRPSARKTSVPIKLIRAFEYWAQQVGARWAIEGFAREFNPNLVDFFEKNGYNMLEQTFVREF